MEFKTGWANRPQPILENNEGPTLVEKAGYIPAQQKIESMMDAGARLVTARREMYDYDDDSQDDEYSLDPLRSVGMDELTAVDLKMAAEARIKRARDTKPSVDVVDSTKEVPDVTRIEKIADQ